MASTRHSAKNILKEVLIETMALGSASAMDYLFKESGSTVFTTALSLRGYYLVKNLSNLLDAKRNHTPALPHLYAALFNTGVAASLYPSIKYLTNPIATAACVFASGVLLRSIPELIIEKKSLFTYLKSHAGNLLSGTTGVLFSAIKKAGIASPSFYWSGEFIDILRNKKSDESYLTLFLGRKATVPLQVFFAYFTKLLVSLGNESLPFPSYMLDFFLGILHRGAVLTHEALVTSPSIPTVYVAPAPVEIKVAPAESAASLNWLMKRGASSTFQAKQSGDISSDITPAPAAGMKNGVN